MSGPGWETEKSRFFYISIVQIDLCLLLELNKGKQRITENNKQVSLDPL